MTIDDVSWHDGLLLEWRFKVGASKRATLELVLDLYAEQIRAAKRLRSVVRCQDVRRFSICCDADELRLFGGSRGAKR